MKRGIITQVSMECDYEEGECSVCHKSFKNKSDYCTHQPKGDPTMDEKTKKPDESSADAAKKKQERQEDNPAPNSELEKENRQLKAQVAELQKRIQEMEAEQKAAASKARAHKLISKLEKQGVDFGTGDDRDGELNRLAELSDEAFSATEAAYDKMAKAQKANAKTQPETEKEPEKQKSKASSEQPMRSSAGVRPHDVDDRKVSLEDRLRNGFMAAYNNRVGNESNETVEIN